MWRAGVGSHLIHLDHLQSTITSSTTASPHGPSTYLLVIKKARMATLLGQQPGSLEDAAALAREGDDDEPWR